jgi:hypothetical protein
MQKYKESYEQHHSLAAMTAMLVNTCKLANLGHERRTRIDQVAAALLERLDGLRARAADLGHDELNVLWLDARLVDLALLLLRGLELRHLVVVAAGRVERGRAPAAHLRLRDATERAAALVHVLVLRLAEDEVAVAVRRLVHLRRRDHVQHLRGVSTPRGRGAQHAARTFFGRRIVTRVMPGTFLRPSVISALRALRSARDWILSSAAADVGSSLSSWSWSWSWSCAWSWSWSWS